jgi:hypothetical protein
VLPVRSPWFGGLLIALAVGRPLGAQDRSLVELGVSYVRFPLDTTSVFGPSARWLGTATRGRVAATSSLSGVVSTGGASAFADLTGAWLMPIVGASSLEVGGELGALVSSGAASSTSGSATSAVASARLLHTLDAGGVWLRANGNLAHREAGAMWGRSVDAGAWGRWAGMQAIGSLKREWTVAQLFTGPGRRGLVGVVRVHFVEAGAAVRAERAAASLELAGSVRRDPGAESLVEAGYSATGSVWLSPSRALLINVSRQLPDFVHGAEALQSVSIGLRLNEPSPSSVRAAHPGPVVLVGSATIAPDSLEGERRVLRVRAAGAHRVEVMGDFTGWESVELTLAGDVFAGSFLLPTGSHRVVVRVDGGDWVTAINTPAVDDDFGGKVGLLLVP